MAGWVGVDLDGTLARYDGWNGPDHIGPAIPAMVKRVEDWLAAGIEVRIFTARIFPYTGVLREDTAMPVSDGRRWQDAFRAACAIASFCREQFGYVLPITCVKDYDMIELWDDRAVQVRHNTGEPVGQTTRAELQL